MMNENKTIRLSKILKELNISLDRAIEHLKSNGIEVETRRTTKITAEAHEILLEGFQSDRSKKVASKEVRKKKQQEKKKIIQEIKKEPEQIIKAKAEKIRIKPIRKIELDADKKLQSQEQSVQKSLEKKENPKPVKKELNIKAKADKLKIRILDKIEVKEKYNKTTGEKENKKIVKKKIEKQKSPMIIQTKYRKLDGPKLTGDKIDLKQFERPEKTENEKRKKVKRKRRRIAKPVNIQKPKPNYINKRKSSIVKIQNLSDEEVKKQVKETLERLQNTKKTSKSVKYRKEKRELRKQQTKVQIQSQESENKILKVTEFITVGEVAAMMNISATEVISTCMTLGMMVTMNQRLDSDTLTIVAEEFDFKVEFVDSEIEEAIQDEVQDKEKDLQPRYPIVTVMGHVDHGKTSLLDYIRSANVIEGESGGITQHIGAYSVSLEENKKITFLDTPGHQAFTAMRARGAKLTDVVIIVIAADDQIMPQTKEAISHAQAAGVPIVFAINKIDKPTANPEKIKEQLAAMDLLVEDWGGKIQSQDISAKKGLGVKELLEKVLLESELLELKVNPNKIASGTVVEAALDKGKGYVSTLLVQNGTLKKGDYILAGKYSGKVRAMFDENGKFLKKALPSIPVSILGLDGAPRAGDKFNVFKDEREAKQIANKRSQLQREQSTRTQKHVTLDEIGRRIALGDFKELNIIIKGDVDGSVEALTGSLQKLSTEKIQINIIHKGVGSITESDILLASASDAIVIGFNVRSSGNAKVIAEKEQIDIRTYSIIYAVIDDIKDAMEGMLSPDVQEEIIGSVEIREVYKISKIGNIAGCIVMQGKVFRNSKIRVIRKEIVVHTGVLEALKRFKDDVKEVRKGYECGIQIKGYNDVQVGDIIETYQEVAVKKKVVREE